MKEITYWIVLILASLFLGYLLSDFIFRFFLYQEITITCTNSSPKMTIEKKIFSHRITGICP